MFACITISNTAMRKKSRAAQSSVEQSCYIQSKIQISGHLSLCLSSHSALIKTFPSFQLFKTPFNQTSIHQATMLPTNQPSRHATSHYFFTDPTIHTAAIYVLIVHSFSHHKIVSSIHPQNIYPNIHLSESH